MVRGANRSRTRAAQGGRTTASGSGAGRRHTRAAAGGGNTKEKASSAEARKGGRPASARREVSRAKKTTGRDTGRKRCGQTAQRAGEATAAKERHESRERKTAASRLAGVSPRTVILVILVVVFVVLSISPVARNLEANTTLKKMESELKKQQAVTESLEKDVGEARSLDYVKKEARRQRMVALGEILYLVTTNSPEREVTYRVKALQSMEEAWARVRQMLHSVPRGNSEAPGGP